MKIQKTIFILLIAVALMLIGNNIVKQSTPAQKALATKNTEQTTTVSLSQTIIHSIDNKNIKKNIFVEEGKTALDVLKKTVTAEVNGEGKNAYVTMIDGQKADDEKREFWAFYVNGKQSQLGAGSYTVKPNDSIEWKIETY